MFVNADIIFILFIFPISVPSIELVYNTLIIDEISELLNEW